MGDRERPLDVEGAPQFGWMPSSAKRDDVQTAYEMEPQTNTLPSVPLSHASDWVTLSWAHPQHTGSLTAYFTVNANSQLPAAVTVSYRTGSDWVPVTNQHVTWATS